MKVLRRFSLIREGLPWVLLLPLLLLLLKTKPLVLCFNHRRWKLSGSTNHLSGLMTPTMISNANSPPSPA
jgi:hypothetical protein